MPKKYIKISFNIDINNSHNSITNAKTFFRKRSEYIMASKHVVPEAKDAMNRFKMEAANELGVFLLLKNLN